jgi:MFS family permease
MPVRSRSVIVYSCLGHLYVHLCTAFYFVIVLALERAWQLPYHELIGLWTLGSLMVGAVALPAGLLSDRVGAPRMMVLYFLGMGACAIGAGLAATPTVLVAALTGMGIFAAIYHPVGVPWLVRNAGAARGKALGFNGVFGSMGTAGAGLTAGILIDVVSWRAAFIVPGAACALTGFALLAHITRGAVSEEAVPKDHTDAESRIDMIRAFAILLVTMFIAGLVYHTIQTSLPKVFAERHDGLVGEGTAGIGLLLAAVYAVAGLMQVVGGHLADRYPLKTVYLATILVQVPAIWLAASLSGLPLVLIATFMVLSGAAQLPAENMLLARFTPARRHGLAFGVKFVLSFGAAPFAVQLVAIVSGRTGGFYWVFAALTGVALLAFTAAAFLPGTGRRTVSPAGMSA